MGLPYAKVTERVSPDDVRSAQHMKKLVDTANDGDDLLIAQHGPGIGLQAGLHLGFAPTVPIGMVIASPPQAGAEDPQIWAVAGYVDESSLKWVRQQDASVVTKEHHFFELQTQGGLYTVHAADIKSSFSGTPTATSGGAGQDNRRMIRPCVDVVRYQVELGRTKVRAYFGPSYTSGEFVAGSPSATGLEQFVVLLYGFRTVMP